jgi:hypothetical protein
VKLLQTVDLRRNTMSGSKTAQTSIFLEKGNGEGFFSFENKIWLTEPIGLRHMQTKSSCCIEKESRLTNSSIIRLHAQSHYIYSDTELQVMN